MVLCLLFKTGQKIYVIIHIHKYTIHKYFPYHQSTTRPATPTTLYHDKLYARPI